MEHGQAADAGAEVAGIECELLDRRGGPAHQQPVEFFLVGARQRPQFSGQGKGHQEIAARQQTGALLLDPALGLVAVTLRTMAIPAGMVGVDLPPAAIALLQMASEVRRTARFDISQGPHLSGQQAIPEACAVGGAVEAENIRHFQHAELWGRIRGPA